MKRGEKEPKPIAGRVTGALGGVAVGYGLGETVSPKVGSLIMCLSGMYALALYLPWLARYDDIDKPQIAPADVVPTAEGEQPSFLPWAGGVEPQSSRIEIRPSMPDDEALFPPLPELSSEDLTEFNAGLEGYMTPDDDPL